MISIIICSINPVLLKQIKENIANTIGTDYEILSKDNRLSKQGICAVYNELAQKAQGDCLCFIHEDVLIETKEWGKHLEKITQDPTVGIIGFAGAGTVSGFPYWHNEPRYYHYTQKTKDGNIHQVFIQKDKHMKKVKVLDGMFLFVRYNVWENNRFDEKLFTGFHLYDIDFSFQIAQNHVNYVDCQIHIIHYSLGNLTIDYYKALILFYKKWKLKLDKEERKNVIDSVALEMLRNIAPPILFYIKYFKEIGVLSKNRLLILKRYFIFHIKKIIGKE